MTPSETWSQSHALTQAKSKNNVSSFMVLVRYRNSHNMDRQVVNEKLFHSQLKSVSCSKAGNNKTMYFML